MSWPPDTPDFPKIPGMDSELPKPRPVTIAPAPTSNGTSSNDASSPANASLMPYTCQTCSRRKVRCDKTIPICAACKKSHLECSYVEPPPRKKKRRNSTEELQQKVEHYEKLLKSSGLLVQSSSTPTGHPSNPQSSVTEDEKSSMSATNEKNEHRPTGTGKLLAGRRGKTHYVDSNLWRNVGDEDLGTSSDEEGGQLQNPASANSNYDPISQAFLSPGSPAQDLSGAHPSHTDAMKMWSAYVDNVEPVVKIFHVPTTSKMVTTASRNPSNISRSTEALLFAIYYFAITSIQEQECVRLFGQTQQTLMSHYEAALRHALVNAHFLRTTEFSVMQAYVLFLLATRSRADPQIFWMLTGVSLRIAQRLGLHRDPESLGLSPYEVQLRRRVWWQLLPLDGLAGQLSGSGLAIGVDTWDTKQPLNVNDTDFDENSTEAPKERDGATDMIFCLTRAQVGKWHQSVHKKLGSWGRVWQVEDMGELEASIDELEKTVEMRFLRFCEIINPIHCMVHTMARTAISGMRLRLRLPRFKKNANPSDEERQALFNLAIKIHDYDCSTYENPSLKRFEWHVRAFFQWDALVWILHEIRENHLTVAQAETSWKRIQKVFENHSDMMLKKGALNGAVRRLTLQAWDAQTRIALRDPAFTVIPEPEVISKLRSMTKTEATPQATAAVPVQLQQELAIPDQGSTWVPPGNNGATIDPWNFNLTTDFNIDNIDWMFWDSMNNGNVNPMNNGFPVTSA